MTGAWLQVFFSFWPQQLHSSSSTVGPVGHMGRAYNRPPHTLVTSIGTNSNYDLVYNNRVKNLQDYKFQKFRTWNENEQPTQRQFTWRTNEDAVDNICYAYFPRNV